MAPEAHFDLSLPENNKMQQFLITHKQNHDLRSTFTSTQKTNSKTIGKIYSRTSSVETIIQYH